MAEYIEREAAIAAVDCTQVIVGDWIRNNIQKIPAADVRPVVRGRWILHDEVTDWDETWECSVCGDEFDMIEGTPMDNGYRFCPSCGADMRETEPQKCDTCPQGAHWDGVVICDRDGQRHERTDGCERGESKHED